MYVLWFCTEIIDEVTQNVQNEHGSQTSLNMTHDKVKSMK